MIKKILTIIFLVLFSLVFTNKAYALLNDVETSINNSLSATSLDFSLKDFSDNPLPSPLFDVSDVQPGSSSARNVRVQKDGNSDYKYGVIFTKTSGDDELCDALQIEAKFEGATKYTGSLSSLSISPAVTNTGASDDWDFTISLSDTSDSLKNKTCGFDLVFKGYQTDSDGTWGFMDQETVGNSISTGTWTLSSDVVINEVMWMGSTLSSADEWIELRNTTGSDIDLTGWKIDNAGESGTSVTLSGTISANGYFLLSNYTSDASAIKDATTPDQVTTDVSFVDGGEQLTLKTSLDVIVDQTPTGVWAAGVNGGPDWKSMERNDSPGDGTSTGSWHTCIDDACNDTTFWDSEGNNYGTPKAANLSSNDPSSKDYQPESTPTPAPTPALEVSDTPTATQEVEVDAQSSPEPTLNTESSSTTLESDSSPDVIPISNEGETNPTPITESSTEPVIESLPPSEPAVEQPSEENQQDNSVQEPAPSESAPATEQTAEVSSTESDQQ